MTSLEPISLVYVTAGSRDEALLLGRTVVRERLAACANVLPGVVSIFEWKGEFTEAEEAVLVLKTPSSQVDTLIARLVALHSYECPAVVALTLDVGHEPFLDWVVAQTRSTA